MTIVIKQIVYMALIATAGLILFILAKGGAVWAASDLMLAPNLSFTDDSRVRTFRSRAKTSPTPQSPAASRR